MVVLTPSQRSDSWKGYPTNRIEIEGFLYAKVNHKYYFIDPDTGVHTQTVERMWGSAKWRHRGTARHIIWNLIYQSS